MTTYILLDGQNLDANFVGSTGMWWLSWKEGFMPLKEKQNTMEEKDRKNNPN